MKQWRSNKLTIIRSNTVDRCHTTQAISKSPVWIDASLGKSGRTRRVALKVTGIEIGRHIRSGFVARPYQSFIRMNPLRRRTVRDNIPSAYRRQLVTKRIDGIGERRVVHQGTCAGMVDDILDFAWDETKV